MSIIAISKLSVIIFIESMAPLLTIKQVNNLWQPLNIISMKLWTLQDLFMHVLQEWDLKGFIKEIEWICVNFLVTYPISNFCLFWAWTHMANLCVQCHYRRILPSIKASNENNFSREYWRYIVMEFIDEIFSL